MKPRMIILVGCAGSGKTYIASKVFGDCHQVNAQMLGQSEALHEVRSALNNLKDVVIDGGANAASDRADFLRIANKYGLELVSAIHIDVAGVEALGKYPKVDLPKLEEGFTTVITTKTSRSAETLTSLF